MFTKSKFTKFQFPSLKNYAICTVHNSFFQKSNVTECLWILNLSLHTKFQLSSFKNKKKCALCYPVHSVVESKLPQLYVKHMIGIIWNNIWLKHIKFQGFWTFWQFPFWVDVFGIQFLDFKIKNRALPIPLHTSTRP